MAKAAEHDEASEETKAEANEVAAKNQPPRVSSLAKRQRQTRLISGRQHRFQPSTTLAPRGSPRAAPTSNICAPLLFARACSAALPAGALAATKALWRLWLSL